MGTNVRPPTVYTHEAIVSHLEPNQGMLAIKHLVVMQYWLFYRFSTMGTTNAMTSVWHQGDWELYQTVLDVVPGSQFPLVPIGAVSQHYYGDSFRYPGPLAFGSTGQPQLFVSTGGHTNYFAPGTYLSSPTNSKPALGLWEDGVPAGLPFWPTKRLLPPYNLTSLDVDQAGASVRRWQGTWGFGTGIWRAPQGPAWPSNSGTYNAEPVVIMYGNPVRFHNIYARTKPDELPE